MQEMTYSGVRYRTSNQGDYITKHPFGLSQIGSHTFTPVRREPHTTIIDNFMMEAFQDYGDRFNFAKLDGWSRSLYTREGHMDSIHRIQSHRRFHKPTDDSMTQTDDYCRQVFRTLGTTQSLDYHTQLGHVPFEPNSAAGIGIPGKKGDPGNLAKAINQAVATLQRSLRDGISSVIEDSTPDMAYTRTQLTQLSTGIKVRNVFGQAFQYILLEGLSASPLMDFFVNRETFFFVGQDPRTAVPYLLESFKKKGSLMMSIDWSAFDTSVENWENVDAFNLLETILTFPNLETRAAFEFSRILFINRKIAAPDGNVYFKQKSVPSGSYYTMLIDSIINWRRILYLHHRATKSFPNDIRTQGDDSLVSTVDSVSPEALMLQIPQDSQWQLNPSKCPTGKSGSSVPFLQRTLKWGDQSRDLDRVERLAIYPEYEVETGEISAFRARALWEDCNYESVVLAHATSYLESKYGIPTFVPRKYTNIWQTLFESKEREGLR